MSSELELFYFPPSYYSQKAYLSLYEKNLPFKKHYVFIHFGEQNEDWFLKLNPDGQVPVLKDGNDVISGSEEIIDYVDRKSKDGACLVPDLATPLGQRVSEIRKWLFAIPIEAVTYGVILNPALQMKPLDSLNRMMKHMTQQKHEKSTRASIESFEKRKKADTSLQGAMDKKIAAYQWKLDTLYDEQKVRAILDDLQGTFDQIERELERSCREARTDEVWMCGTTFTAADVEMAVLLNRVSMVGIDSSYYSASKRPLVLAYRNRLYNRTAMKRFLEESSMEAGIRLVKRKVMKDVAKKTLKVAAFAGVLALVAFGVREYIRRK